MKKPRLCARCDKPIKRRVKPGGRPVKFCGDPNCQRARRREYMAAWKRAHAGYYRTDLWRARDRAYRAERKRNGGCMLRKCSRCHRQKRRNSMAVLHGRPAKLCLICFRASCKNKPRRKNELGEQEDRAGDRAEHDPEILERLFRAKYGRIERGEA